jgi:hypothetical protein
MAILNACAQCHCPEKHAVTGLVRTIRGYRVRGRSPAIAVILLLVVLASPGATNDPADSEVEIRLKAAYIYNFARFVEWPARSGNGPVRIGVLGKGDLASPLAQVVRGKMANGRSIEVAQFDSMTDSDCCEILLIERSESKHIQEIVLALSGKPVLTVCDATDGLREGVMISFRVFEESVRFEINKEAAERAGLRISSQLLKVALPGSGKHP